MKRHLLLILFFLLYTTVVGAMNRVSHKTKVKLQSQLPVVGLTIGDNVLIRTFKKESQLELWMRPHGQTHYVLFKTYPICYYSGDLGPKRQTGDHMTPEGYYAITQNHLNPNSHFHLSMNIGFPNDYDRQLGRTGSLLMIHGACDSIGCFAMGNNQIEEIYYLVEKALENRQNRVPVHAFPFHLTAVNLATYRFNQWYGFWVELSVGYRLFNQTKIPPTVMAMSGHYLFSKGRR
ncbi:MAG: L,D-transpeptidase family protein [Ostreibacterium sp.]